MPKVRDNLVEQEQSVLIVDDEPACLRTLQEALRDLDCRILVSKSGEKAISIAQSQSPSVILLDVAMTGMDGFETCAHLKQDPLTSNSVVIFLSAHQDVKSRLRGLKVGGVDYINKPFSADEVRAKVETHLEMQRLQRELKIKNDELKEANEQQNFLLGMAAHDLRTPLTAILIAAKTLRRRSKLNPEQEEELIDIVEGSSEEMQGLIEELLSVSRLRSEAVRLNRSPVDLNALVLSRLSLHQFMAENKEITIETELTPLPELKLDPGKIAQVFDNLISNAIKYSWPKSVVAISSARDDKSVTVSVADNGVGIEAQELGKVFEPFSKIQSKPTSGEQSHGLGLSIVNNIVRSHGGQAMVQSVKGKGSKFSIKFPIKGLAEEKS